jgi:hypothetical protein
MTEIEYITRLKEFEQNYAGEIEKEFVLTLSKSIGDQADRIFVDGQVGENGTMMTYARGEVYINPSTAPRNTPLKGKNEGGATFKNGNKRKTSYFASYSDFKVAIGQTNYVNLVLFGNFQRAFRTGIRYDGLSAVHFITDNAFNPDGKVQGLRDNFPGAFELLPDEERDFTDKMDAIVDDILQEYL